MSNGKGLKTFEGVYVPTILTILGVILYLRLGWIVGNAGLWNTLIIIVIAHTITLCTALSMSSMLTNINIGPGGAYAIITRSLGLEMGGAIGIPLYLSQSISVAFYITGFSELWITFFPDHSIKLVGVLTWALLTILSIIGARLAFKIQYFILGAVVLSIISFLTGHSLNPGPIVLTGGLREAGFWATFAIFFPAVTGVLTGATMSGELENPRKSIITGTLAAVITGFGVYILLAIWFAKQATQTLLLADNSIILRLGSVRFIIIAGVMGAVLSSALSALVSAPRTLSALSENRVVPFSNVFAKKNKNGEPLNAIIISSLISFCVLFGGNLNSLAELLTMIFLTTYSMINLVVFLEQKIGITSFRPTMSMPIYISLIGAFGCFFAMILINPFFTVVTLILTMAIYTVLKKRNMTSPWGDVRGGIFSFIAEWAAQKSMSLPYHPRLWKPSIVIPVEKPEDFRRISRLLQSIIFPSGRIYYMNIYEEDNIDSEYEKEIDDELIPLKAKKIFTQKVLIKSQDFNDVLIPTLQCLSSTFLSPNAVLFTISDDLDKRMRFKNLYEELKPIKMAVMCLWLHPKYNIGPEQKINFWLRDKSPNNDLIVLCALQIARNVGAEIKLCRVVNNAQQKKKEENQLKKFIEDARLPINTKIDLFAGDFKEIFKDEIADLSILGMPSRYEEMLEVVEISPGSLLFIATGGMENALS
ncbi:amino acid permease [Clostridium sp.]|uniref:amino acid permease n=1 Tax=Clostridium sp. TaxID=1506 RepID=UPI001A38022D|nr:amino acid permease [Clostridium sp.]MBK5234621.1 hypothetical protein [Clostridium sp.]